MENIVYRVYCWCDEHGEFELYFDTLWEARSRAFKETFEHIDHQGFKLGIWQEKQKLLEGVDNK